MKIPIPRLALNCCRSMVRNSLATTSSGSVERPACPELPPVAVAEELDGQMIVWKTMLSLPMK